MNEVFKEPGDIRLFLVQDNEILMKNWKEFFRSQGFEIVATAMNGMVALSFVQECDFTSPNSPNVAVLDFGIGYDTDKVGARITGLSVAKAIRAKAPDFPLVSGSSDFGKFREISPFVIEPNRESMLLANLARAIFLAVKKNHRL